MEDLTAIFNKIIANTPVSQFLYPTNPAQPEQAEGAQERSDEGVAGFAF